MKLPVSTWPVVAVAQRPRAAPGRCPARCRHGPGRAASAVDRLAGVVDRTVAHDRDRAGVGVDLHLADRAAGRIGRDAAGEGRFGVQASRRPAPDCRPSPCAMSKTVSRRLLLGARTASSRMSRRFRDPEQLRRHGLRLRHHSPEACDHQRAGEPHRAVGVRAAAGGSSLSPPMRRCLPVHPQQIGHHLR